MEEETITIMETQEAIIETTEMIEAETIVTIETTEEIEEEEIETEIIIKGIEGQTEEVLPVVNQVQEEKLLKDTIEIIQTEIETIREK